MEENLMVLAISEQETESTPKSIIIDESVRLAKKFGTENSYKFVNANFSIYTINVPVVKWVHKTLSL